MLFAALFVIQQPKVSLEICGERLVVCAPKIAQALGMERLDIKPPFQEEVAAIRVTNVDRETLKQKIEQAFRGSFIQREGTWSFEQTPEEKAKESQEHFDSLTKYQQEFIDGAKKFIPQYQPFTAEMARLLIERRSTNADESKVPWKGSDDLQTPIGRFTVEVVARLSANHWYNTNRTEHPTVFALYPTAMQKALPVPVDDLITKFLSNQAIYARAFKKHQENSEFSESGSAEDFVPSGRNDLTNLAVVLDESGLQCYFFLNKGTVRVNSSFSAGELGPDYPDVNLKPPVIHYSPLSRDYITECYSQNGGYLSRVYDSERRPEISKRLRDALLTPETIEPLSLAIPERLFDANPGKNIVANLHEYLLYDSNLSEEDYNLFKDYKTNFHYKDGWLVVTLEDPYDLRKTTLNRARMGMILRSFINGPYPTLEQQAQWPELCDLDSESLLMRNLKSLMQGRAMIYPEHETFLQLFGSLTPEERGVAARRPISLGALNQGFLQTLFNVVFNLRYPEPSYNLNIEEDSPEEARKYADQVVSFLNGLGSEPTFRHPDGLHAKMSLKIEESKRVELLLKRKTIAAAGVSEIRMDAAALGSHKYHAEHSKESENKEIGAMGIDVRSPYDFKDFDLNSIQIVGIRTVRIIIDSNSGFEYAVEASQPLPSDSKTYSLNNLPSSILDKVNEAYKGASESEYFFSGRLRRRVDGIPPPPLR